MGCKEFNMTVKLSKHIIIEILVCIVCSTVLELNDQSMVTFSLSSSLIRSLFSCCASPERSWSGSSCAPPRPWPCLRVGHDPDDLLAHPALARVQRPTAAPTTRCPSARTGPAGCCPWSAGTRPRKPGSARVRLVALDQLRQHPAAARRLDTQR